jgi:hypothetical protein
MSVPVRTTAALFATLAFLFAFGSQASARQQSTVPAPLRSALVNIYGGMAYIPARLPAGYAYRNWSHSVKPWNFEYRLNFRSNGSGSGVSLEAVRRACPPWPAKGTVRVNRHVIKWARSNAETTTWRCLKYGGRSFVLFGLNGSLRSEAYVLGYAVAARRA